MIIVQDIMVSDDLLEQQFMCNLNACKGACCWEGDFGAPLEAAEVNTLEEIYDDIVPFLTPAGRAVIEKEGKSLYYEDMKSEGTPLLENGACAYLTYDALGRAQCGIEQAWAAGVTSFRKPISCHLYPIRVEKEEELNFEALNYDRWDICSAACTLGREKQMPVYRFAREALIRKYGEAFYEELDAAATFIRERDDNNTK